VSKFQRTVRFVKTEKLGVLPASYRYLLSQRAATRKRIKTCTDPFERGILDGMQLAYKLTANSAVRFFPTYNNDESFGSLANGVRYGTLSSLPTMSIGRIRRRISD
jgi:hypothetical protein